MPGLLAVLTAFGKVGFGSIVGYFQKKQAMKVAEQEHRFELERLDKQADLQQRLGAMRLEETQTESERAIMTAAIQADAAEGVQRQKAYTAEGKDVRQWVRDLRGFTRPGITWVLVVSVIWLTAAGNGVEREALLPVIVAATELAIGFWFGGKMTQQFNGKR